MLPEIDPALLKAPPAPNARSRRRARIASDKPGPEQLADPKLLEIARIEIERDCYKAAEARNRKALKKLQATVNDLQ